MNRRWIRFDVWTLITLGIVALIAMFLIYPLIILFTDGFREIGTGNWTLANYRTFFSHRFFSRAITNTLQLSAVVTLVSIVLGVPLAYFMSFYKIKGKTILEILFIICLMSPAFIGAYSWVILLGRSGYVTVFMRNVFGIQTPSIYGFTGMIIVFTLRLYPFIFMFLSSAFQKIDVSLVEAAEGLGCSGARRIWNVLMPLVTPMVVSSGLLVFMMTMADFGTPALIGEGFSVMPTLIFFEFLGETGGSAYFASAISTVMVAMTTTLFLVQKWYVNRKSFTMSALRPIQPKKPKGLFAILSHAYIYILAMLSMIPQAVVIFSSFRNTHRQMFVAGFSLDSYRAVIRTAGTAIRNTYVYSLIAIIIIVAIGMCIAYLSVRRRNWLTNAIDSAAMLPFVIPGSVLGITLLVSVGRPPFSLIGTATILIVALAIRRISFTLRSSSAILYQISPSLEEAAVSLGDSSIMSFIKVTGRVMIPGVISGAILSWITLINELSASVMLHSAGTRTMAVAIYTEVIRGNHGNAAALGAILTVSTIIAMLIFFKISGKRSIA